MDKQTRDGGYYSFEKLEIYHLALEFRRLAKQIMRTIPAGPNDDDVSQLNRSSKSSVRNVCEGAGEFRPKEKARFYRMALRSAEESGGTLKILEVDTGSNPLYADAHAINQKFIAKLTVLCRNRSKR